MTYTPGAVGSTTSDIEIIGAENDRPHGTRVRGSALWAGAVTALSTFILLEMILLTTDLSGTQVSVANPDTGSWAWDAIAAIVAFFVGGLVAGASVPYRSVETGALNGIVTWASAVAAIVLLSGVVGGAIFGALGDVLVSNSADISQNTQATESTAEDARSAAGWAAIALTATLAAAGAGGVVGSKMWPNKRNNTMAK